MTYAMGEHPIQTSVGLPPADLRKLKAIGEADGRSMSQLMRRAIQAWLAEQPDPSADRETVAA